MNISVVIPAYNEETYLPTCLESLARQTVKPDEIIVVDNNCTDHTCEVASRFQIRVVPEMKQGMIYARNRGFNEAQGDIIARCDADVILPPNWIEKILNNFKTSAIDALTGGLIYHDLPFSSVWCSYIYLDAIKLIQRGRETLLGPNMAITKRIWGMIKNDVCLEDKNVHEDLDLGIHILRQKGITKRDPSLVVKSSARRIKKQPVSFFVEYPIRLFKTLTRHGRY